MNPEYIYRATCFRVVDGDTYYLNIDLGFNVALTVDVRLRGVNTPELDTAEGKEARDFVTGLLSPSILGMKPTPLIVQSYKGRKSFERWVCDVWFEDSSSLSDTIIEAGHGVVMER